MTDDETLAQLRRLEPDLASLVGLVDDGEVFDCGPFRAMISQSTSWANVVQPIASPDDGDAVVAAVEEIRRRFAERGRSPRFLFREPFFPDLATDFDRAGLRLSEREPLMACAPTDLRPSSRPEISVRFLGPEDADTDLIAFQRIRSEAFDEHQWEATDGTLAAFRAELRHFRGHGAALATLDAQAAGTGFLAVYGEGSEITRVATRPDLRRRGVAATVTSFLARAAFDGGARLVWLTAATPEARALYEGLGFRYAGDELTYVPPDVARSAST